MKRPPPAKETTKPKSSSRPVATFTEAERVDFMAFTIWGAFDQVADYVARGRIFAALLDDQLTARFIEAVRTAADDPTKWERRAVQNDIESEFQLRGGKPPYGLVADQIDRFCANAAAAMERLKEEDQDRYAEIAREIANDFERFLNERANSN
jgi:hypothetical protein